MNSRQSRAKRRLWTLAGLDRSKAYVLQFNADASRWDIEDVTGITFVNSSYPPGLHSVDQSSEQSP
jgi:hypothetical protein